MTDSGYFFPITYFSMIFLFVYVLFLEFYSQISLHGTMFIFKMHLSLFKKNPIPFLKDKFKSKVLNLYKNNIPLKFLVG